MLSSSAVDLVPGAELLSVDIHKLIVSYTERPVVVAAARSVKSCVPAVFKKVLNGEYNESCVACKHRTDNRIVAVVPICAFVAEIVKESLSVLLGKLPNVAKERIVVVCARVGNAVV